MIYTYDSFVAPGGLGAQIIPVFEKQCGCRVRALASGDGTQLLTRLEWDAKAGRPTAQLVVGIDQLTWEKAKPWVASWGDWTPRGYDHLVESALVLGKGFLPYDYGILAFMMDRLRMKELQLQPPLDGKISIQSLLDPKWKRNIILEDPRTSSPGLAFFLYTSEIFKQEDQLGSFWENFRKQWLTLTPGWSGAYGLFLKKEAPLVWSYISSQAYHQEQSSREEKEGIQKSEMALGKSQRYQALLFQEGQPVQIEGAVLIQSATHSKESMDLAKKFLEFLISPEIQKKVPQGAWMMPVLKGIELPASFQTLPQPVSLIQIKTNPEEMTKLLSRWKRIVGRSF